MGESKDPESSAALSGFEDALKTLESLVERMEAGDQTLEQAFSDYQQGVLLVQRCQKALHFAEQRVAVLSHKADQGFEQIPYQAQGADDQEE